MMRQAARKYTVKLYTPHAGQRLLHECSARFRIMACGRRFGKTLAATNELAKKALEAPSSLNWWIAPTYRQTEIAFELLSSALAPVLTQKPNKSKMRLDLINGSVIECRSAERYENMRGDGPSFVVFDEASKCPKAAWQEVVRPALADHQGGAIFISTPWGRDWFWELFMRGQDANEPEYWSHSFPTWANPFIPREEIDEARRTLPAAVFAQEYEAVFLDDAASVFHHVDACIRPGWFLDPVVGHYYVIGWDIAKYEDYSVFTVIDCNTRDVVYWERFNGIDYRSQIDAHLIPLVQRYQHAYVIMDVTGLGDPLLEEVRRRDIAVEGVYFTNARKKELIDETVLVLEQRRLTFPPIMPLLDELKAFGYEFTPSRNLVYRAPDGQHDDCVMSLALAIHGARLGQSIGAAVTSFDRPSPQGEELPVPPSEDDEETKALLQCKSRILRSLRFIERLGGGLW